MARSGAAAMADHSRLGRGLASLMGDVAEESPTAPDAARKPRRAPIENLKANPRNPRKNFTDTELNELADSIKERGVIQPIVVRTIPGERDNFEIIAGERRWRPDCTRCQSRWWRRPPSSRSNLPSSKTCSAPTSIQWKRRAATRN